MQISNSCVIIFKDDEIQEQQYI